MAKQNTKSTLKKKLSKKKKTELVNKLDNAVKSISKRNLYFVSGNKDRYYSVIDSTTKQPIFKEIPISEAAQLIVRLCNTTSKTKIRKVKDHIEDAIIKHGRELNKHINDLYFYNHTLKTTKDIDKVIITEARKDMSLNYYYKIKHTFLGQLQNQFTEVIDYKKM